MNKILLFLAFATFALFACSNEKTESNHFNRCTKSSVSKGCLSGSWLLESIDGGNSKCKLNSAVDNILELKDNGRFLFTGGFETNGTWGMDGKTMKIGCEIGECLYENTVATVEVLNTGLELRITTTNGFSGFFQCSVGAIDTRFTEVYSWQGND